MKTYKTIAAAAMLIAAAATQQVMAQAQATAVKPAAAASTPGPSIDSLVGELLDYPAAKAVLLKHMPAIGADDQIEQARGTTFRSLQDFAPEAITDALLAAIDADLHKLSPPPAHAAPGAK